MLYLLFLQSFEDLYKHVSNDLYDLMIVIVEGHLKVKTNKLCQMPMCVGILSSEYCKHKMRLSMCV